MKKIYFGILCCLLGFTTSCSDDDNATALLQIDPSTDLVFEAVGGTRTIEVKTDQATWQVESNQTWCKVEKSDGTHFTVTAEENTASEPKPQAVVTVTAGTAQVVLKVDQKGTATPPLAGTTFEITLGEPTPTGVNMKVGSPTTCISKSGLSWFRNPIITPCSNRPAKRSGHLS
jgi:hypothetical protein